MDEADISQKEIDHQLKITLINMEADQAKQKQKQTVTECVECGAEIPLARQEAVPGCQHCITCAQINEQLTNGVKRV